MHVETVVVGAGGFGREALDVVEAHNTDHQSNVDSQICVLGVIDDTPSPLNLTRLSRRGYSFLGNIEHLLSEVEPRNYILGIGAPKVRYQIAERLELAGWTPLTVIHPNAVIGSVESIGLGTIICGGVQVSTNTRLGRYVHLNPNSTIGHDTVLEDFVSVNPGAVISGEVHIGPYTLVGAGSVILQQLSIGESALIGAGACVTRPIANATTVIGVPARPITTNPSEVPKVHGRSSYID